MRTPLGAIGHHRTAADAQAGQVVDEEDWNPYTLEELDEMVKTKSPGYVLPLLPFPLVTNVSTEMGTLTLARSTIWARRSTRRRRLGRCKKSLGTSGHWRQSIV